MRHLISAALLGALLIGCGGTQMPMPPGAQSTLRADYADVLKRSTRSVETYEHFESRVFAKATYFSLPFAQAYARQRSERLGLSPLESKAELERLEKAAKGEVRFFVQLVTNDYFWNDLDKYKGTLRARLMVNGEPVDPKKITRLTDDDMSDMTPFFPYVSVLARGYWVTFPRPDVGTIHLRISGSPAIVDMQWPK